MPWHGAPRQLEVLHRGSSERERFSEAENLPADWQHHHFTPAGALTSPGSRRACVTAQAEGERGAFLASQVIWSDVSISRHQGCPAESGALGKEDGAGVKLEMKSFLFIEQQDISFFWYSSKYLIFKFNWRIITLQYCGGFCHTSTWIAHRYTCIPPPHHSWTRLPPPSHPIPLGYTRARTLSALLHALSSHWSPVFYTR